MFIGQIYFIYMVVTVFLSYDLENHIQLLKTKLITSCNIMYLIGAETVLSINLLHRQDIPYPGNGQRLG